MTLHSAASYSRLRWFAGALLCFLAPLFAQRAVAAKGAERDVIEQACEECADKIEKIFREHSYTEKEVWVREFKTDLSVARDVQKGIGDALTKRGFKLSDGSKAQIEGRVIMKVSSGVPYAFHIRGEVFFRGDEKKPEEFTAKVNSRDAAERRDDRTREYYPPPIDNPGEAQDDPTIVGRTRIQPSPRSPYAVEILVKRGEEYVPLAASKDPKTKVIRVALKEGDVYAVKLYNGTQYEAAVSISIDGLSRFALADNEEDRKCMDLLPPVKDGVEGIRRIDGYFRAGGKEGKIDEFTVGEYSKSVVAKRQFGGDPSHVGSIKVNFAAAWMKGSPPPPGDDKPPLSSINDKGTMQGKSRPDPTEKVERVIGLFRAGVSVMY